jgi:hypothetical protein
MKPSQIFALPAIVLLLGSAAVQTLAQTPKPETPAAGASAATSNTDKKAVSKQCSD